MQKTILITGSTDGIGLETAKVLVNKGCHVIVHGRNADKVQQVTADLTALGKGKVDSIVADLSSIKAVKHMVTEFTERFNKPDVIINNAGVYKVAQVENEDGLDVRFVVNSIAPYILTKGLLPLLDSSCRVINLSSAAQSSVNLKALIGAVALADSDAYAQSKLALTMWSTELGLHFKGNGPMIVAINPKSFLGSKMVKEAYGMQGKDLSLGADILVRAALSDEFAHAHGAYYDNDIEAFAEPHPDALNEAKSKQVIGVIEAIIEGK